MAVAVTESSTALKSLANDLHPRLLHLFTRWPPSREEMIEREQHFQDRVEGSTPWNFLPQTNRDAPTKTNPFMPWKNPATGNWHGAHYSLRRQAELFKLAKKYNVLPLMPLSPKHPDVKAQKLERRGPMRRNADGDLIVKGKKWERQLNAKIEKRAKAMVEMPELIKKWRLSGNGRGWKKWPK